MAAAKVVWQVICPTCSNGAPQGSPYCDKCGTSLSNIPAVQIESKTMQIATPDHVLKKFLNEEQDPALVRQIYEKALQIMVEGEEIEYIATANKTMVGISFDCVVATNRRLIDYKKKMLGKVALDDCFWRDVREVEMKEARQGVSLMVETIQGWRLTVESLPRAQAWRLYEVGAEYNPKLQARLHDMLGAASAQQIDHASVDHATAVPVHPYGEFDHAGTEHHNVPWAGPVSDHLGGARPADPASTGPLPLIMPPSTESFPVQGWQAAPAMSAEPPHYLPENISFEQPSMPSLDDLFSPLMEKELSNSSHQEEQPTHNPTPMAQAEQGSILFDVPVGEQSHNNEIVPAHVASYQSATKPSPVASTSNGSNGNGSNGNGSNGNGKGIGALQLPRMNGLLTPEVSETPHVDLPRALPQTMQPDIRSTHESRQTETANQHLHSNTTSEEHQKVPTKNESPMRKLRQLKRMLDAGLITQEDYEVKKTDILSRI